VKSTAVSEIKCTCFTCLVRNL